MQGPQQEVQGPPVNRKYVQELQNMWPLHTLEALATLFVALAQTLAPEKLAFLAV